MNRLLALLRSRPRLSLAFLLACAVTLYFGGRFVTFTIYWASHRDLPVEPWMTVGYAARSWGVDPRALAQALDLPPEAYGAPQPLVDLARDRGMPLSELLAEVETAIRSLGAAGPGE